MICQLLILTFEVLSIGVTERGTTHDSLTSLTICCSEIVIDDSLICMNKELYRVLMYVIVATNTVKRAGIYD